ncbi:hypothetical protein [Tunicatimonas pelagia]|uniref:hypothetical protein n=1 Tax=Tunicatimonas pelagia TaxID=931531 RepID=UPI002666C40C|nr:hypothetical protein [Tunicatimonas pelagia]WKN42680.1 hypothetical protein P0M28_26950 [Tunicatimonas pelagia]
MVRYPELLKVPEIAERFYKEFRDVLPQEKFFTDFCFVDHCDGFQWAFYKHLLNDQSSLFKVNSQVRSYFLDNSGYVKRLALYAIFVKECMEETGEMLLEQEYYELMPKFEASQSKILDLVNMLMGDAL